MAYITGTANDRAALLAVLHTNLSANGWVIDRYAVGDELIAHGSGFGTGDVYIGYKIYTDLTADANNFEVKVFTGFVSANSFHNQPGASPDSVQCLWDNPINYWLYINNRRVILVAKISTVYEISYLGLINPYGPSNAFPYAGFVGGNSADLDRRYSDITTDNTNYNCQYSSGSGTYVRSPSGTWLSFAESPGYSDMAFMYPTRCFRGYGVVDDTSWSSMTVDADGNHWLVPFQPMITDTGASAEKNVFGELDGTAWISSFGLSPEDTATIAGDTYDIFPNVFRSGFQDFLVIKREV